jgi:hypothetical protein
MASVPLVVPRSGIGAHDLLGEVYSMAVLGQDEFAAIIKDDIGT